MALGNIGLDLLGQARSLYAYAAEAEAAGNDEDGYAYRRDAPQYRNLLLVEQPNGDFAQTMVRQLFYSAFADPYWRAMMASGDATLAAVAAKSEKESAYHLRHASEWVIRLGDGTAESHRRAQDAVDGLWPYTGEMFEQDAAEDALVAAGAAIAPATMRAGLGGDGRRRAGPCHDHAGPAAPGCRAAAAPAGTASISATCSAPCSTSSAPCPARNGSRWRPTCRPGRWPPRPPCATRRSRC